MCMGGSSYILRRVFDGERVRLILEIEPEGPIRGEIAAGGEPASSFSGWLELAAAMTRAREQAARLTSVKAG